MTESSGGLVRRLLWIDCVGGLLAGVTVLTLSGWLARLEGLPQGVLVFTGVVNLLYGSFSLSLALRARRPLRLVTVLALANLAWFPVCVGLLAAFAGSATPFAVAHLGGEGLYVAALGLVEWRNRHRLAGTAPEAADGPPAPERSSTS